MKILITGSTGFIGSAVALDLKSRGEDVVGLVRKTSDKSVLEQAGISLRTGDILDKESLINAFRGIDAVIHTAGCVSDWARKKDFVNQNYIGTRNVLEACLEAGVRRLIYFSTINIFGHSSRGAISEDSPIRPNPGGYGYSKALAEKLVREYMSKGLLDITTVYPSWVYGKGDKNFVPVILKLMDRNMMMFFRNHGNHYIELNYIGNLTEAVATLLKNRDSIGKGYILSDLPKVTYKEFVDRIAEGTGHKRVRLGLPYAIAYSSAAIMEFVYGMLNIYKKRPLLTRQTVALLGNNTAYDVSALHSTGYKQKFSYDEAMKEALEYYLRI